MTGMIPMLSQGKSSSKENVFSSATLPAGSYSGLGYNGSVWAAVCSGSTQAASSSDGTTWTSRSSSSANGWQGIGNVGSTFCSVSSGGAQTSTDGVTWTARTMPSAEGYSLRYHYGGTTPPGFLAISNGKGAYSTNGITWTEFTWPNSRSWQYGGISYNGSMWLYTVDNFSYWYYTSTNGTTWTERKFPIKSLDYDQEGDFFNGPGWTGTHFVVARGYGRDVIRSTDGINWTEVTPNAGHSRVNPVSNPQYVPFMGNGTFASAHNYAGDAWVTKDGSYWRRYGLRKGAGGARGHADGGLWTQVVYSPTMISMLTGNRVVYMTNKDPGLRS